MLGALFFLSVSNFMNNYFGTVLVFQTERPVFLREQANKMYGVSAYYLSKMITEMPVLIAAPLVMELVVYWGVMFSQSLDAFFGMFFALALIGQVAAALGYFVSSLFNRMETATTVSSAFTMPIILLGGFFANSNSFGWWIMWMQYFSPIKYGFEMMTRTQTGYYPFL